MASRDSAAGAVVALVVLVLAQAAALLAVAGLYAVRLLAGQPADLTASLFGAVLALVAGLALAAAARALLHRRRWARAPVLVVQLLVALVAAGPGGLTSAGRLLIGVPLLLWALAVSVLLFSPGAAPTTDPGAAEPPASDPSPER